MCSSFGYLKHQETPQLVTKLGAYQYESHKFLEYGRLLEVRSHRVASANHRNASRLSTCYTGDKYQDIDVGIWHHGPGAYKPQTIEIVREFRHLVLESKKYRLFILVKRDEIDEYGAISNKAILQDVKKTTSAIISRTYKLNYLWSKPHTQKANLADLRIIFQRWHRARGTCAGYAPSSHAKECRSMDTLL